MNYLSQFLVESILSEADGVNKVVVVYAGRFQPFHKGHFATYTHLTKKFGKDNVFIGTSNKTDNDKSPFNFKEKKEIMTTMFGVPSNKIVEVKNPYRPIEILGKYDDETTAFITVVGEKDEARLGGKYFQKFKDGIELQGYKDNGYVYVSPAQSNPISGTDVRNNLGKNVDDDTKMDFFTKRAYPKFNKKIYDLITKKLSESYEPLYISKEVIEEWVASEFPKFLKEVSATPTSDGGDVDDGPNFFFPNYDVFDRVSKTRAEHIGYTVFKQIMSGELEDYYEHPIYPTGPVKAVTPFPAGVIGKTTATNQKDFMTSVAYDKWFKHVSRSMALAGYSLVRNKDEIEKRLAVRDLVSYRKMTKKKDPIITAGNVNESLGVSMGYPSKIDLERKLKQLKDLRAKLNSTKKGDEYYEPALGGGIAEDIVRLNNSLNINRDKLPQIDKDELENYLEYLESNNIPFDIEFQPVASLNSTQSEVDIEKVKSIMSDGDSFNTPIIVSKDDYILDGHHRALAAFNTDKGSEVPVIKVDLSLDELINISNEFDGSYNQSIEEFQLTEAITLPVEVGDTILTGKFKNKKVVVKTIGKDEHGMPTINGKKVVTFRIMNEGTINEIPMADLVKIDQYADKQLNPVDVVLTDKHFFDRLQDPRNKKDISAAELIGFFKRLAKNKKKFVEFLNQYGQIVAKDNRSKINIPFMKQANKVIAKTIMRKDDFKTSSPEYQFEAQAVSGGKVHKFITGKNLTLKGKKYSDIEFEVLKIDNTSQLVSLKVLAPKNLFGHEINVPFRTIRRGPFLKTNENMIRLNKLLNEVLLLEGGAYGHMNHPFDNEINLTFGQLKDIVNRALDGELELAREKTDGQALAISWVNGKLVAARNKGHLANKGANALDIKGIATKFAGRGELEKAYNFAMNDLSKAIKSLSEKQRDKIFKGGACFMNLEVIYPTSVNVIPYGQALLVFHGTMEYNEKGEAIGENQQAARILAGMIKQVNQDVQKNYTIQGPPVTKLPKSQKLSSLKGKYNAQIQKLQSQFGLSDNAGISEYHQAWWTNFIQTKSPSALDNTTLVGLVKRWAFYDKSFRLDAKNISDPKVLEWAKGIDKNDHAKIAKNNIRPFEDIFLGVGADVLSFMSSVLTANPDSAVRAMKDRLDKTIADVQKGGDPKKIDKLKLELERLNAIGGKDKIVPNEGIVFVYGGNTFKLTGTFAPLNQILGLFYEK